MPPSQGTSWEDWYRWILCEIYKKAGGDCKDLTGDDSSRAMTFVEYFDVHGVPVFPDPVSQAEFVALLVQLQAHLLLPGNDLSSKANQELTDKVNKLIEALKG